MSFNDQAFEFHSKLELNEKRVMVTEEDAKHIVQDIFHRLGCPSKTATMVAEHLTDSNLCGMESHGLMRTLQYAEQFQNGYLIPEAEPCFRKTERGTYEIDGGGGIGIPAMHLAYEQGMSEARKDGVTALAIRNVGHTGRLGAFADHAAEQGYLTIIFGGGNREKWRQVAPHGGAKAMLPTNPYCLGIPGGNQGPVVIDIATSSIAGGWIYAAESAGALIPEGCLIEREGNPSRNPRHYFEGGAILPAGKQKGYALALVAEIMAEALLGPSTTEANWLLLVIDCSRYRGYDSMQHAAENVLDEIRNCPPAPGFERVEIPGERERNCRKASQGKIHVPSKTWKQILDLKEQLKKP